MTNENQLFDSGLSLTMGGAALTTVSISTWEAKRVSREMAKAIAADRGIDARLVSTKVTIMEDPVLAAIYQLRDNTRRWWWHNTLPYRLKGIRIWADDIEVFTDYVLKARDQMNVLAGELADTWTNRVDAQRLNLRGEFDPSLYPCSSEVRDLFGIHIGQITPLYLSPEDLPQILKDNPEIARQQLDDAKAALAEGMGDLWYRMENALEDIIKRLGGKGRIHENTTLMGSLSDIVDVLPGLNVSNDPALNEVAKQLKEKVLTISDSQLLSAGKEQRVAVADAARSVIGKVKARGKAPAKVEKKAPAAPVAKPVKHGEAVSRVVKKNYAL
jgi:hypothetical protein